MDTIKTRLQIEGPSGRFLGPMDCFRKTIKNEGFLGLYKGQATVLNMSVSFFSTVFFSMFRFLFCFRHGKSLGWCCCSECALVFRLFKLQEVAGALPRWTSYT